MNDRIVIDGEVYVPRLQFNLEEGYVWITNSIAVDMPTRFWIPRHILPVLIQTWISRHPSDRCSEYPLEEVVHDYKIGDFWVRQIITSSYGHVEEHIQTSTKRPVGLCNYTLYEYQPVLVYEQKSDDE